MTNKPFLQYPLATTTWDEAEYAALHTVIESGQFTMGEQVRNFEEEFAAFFGSKYAVMVNSGSSANLVALGAALYNPDIDLNVGDEVIVPAVSWATTYYPVSQLGLKIRFVDVDAHTFNLDVDQVESAIGPRTKAVFAVSLLGNPVDFEQLAQICSDHSMLLIEDNCESLGAKVGERYTGTFGVMGTFSTYFSHHISTMEGGLTLTDDRFLYEAMISLRSHGWTRELPVDNLIFPKTGEPFDDQFRFILPGYNVRPLEISGAIGREQLKKVPEIVRVRQENGDRFVALFGGREDLFIQETRGQSSWFGFGIVLDGPLRGRRPEVVRALNDAGIESRPIVAGNFTKNPVMKHLNAQVPDELPGADRIDVDGFFVGNHHYPIPGELEMLANALSDLRV